MLTQKGAALLACLALAAFSSSHAFAPVIGFAPSIQGSFVSSVRVPTLRTARSGRVTPSFSVLTVAAALRNAGMIGKPIPANYKEGEQYTMGGKFAVGDLVFVKRSDGTNRYGEIVGAAGLPWQDQWEVVVQLDGTDVGATRVELAKDIGKVLVGGAAAPSGGSMLIGRGATPSRAVPPPAKRGAPAPVRPTGTARVGSQRLTIPRGQQSARGQPARPPAPKAPAPKKISLVARAPPAQTPKPAARAAPAPTRTPSARVPAAKGAAAGKAAAPVVPFADKLSKTVPATWNEGEEYSAATQVEPRQLVLVDTATGLKFAVVLAKTGFFWQKNYRVATSVSPSGGVGSEEEVSIEALYKPTQAALDEMEQPVAAAAGFFAGLFKSLTGAPLASILAFFATLQNQKEEEKKKKAAPAFPKAAAKPPAAPPTGPLGSILGTIGSLIPEDKKEVKKEVAKPAPAAAKPSAATAPPPKAPAAKAPPGGGRVGSIANLAETASGAGRDVALGFLNGLSKVLGDDASSPKPPPAKAPAPAAKAPDAKAAPAKPPAAPAPPKKEAPKKEEAKKEEVKKEEAKKEEVKKEAPKKEEVKKEEVKAAAPKEEPKKEEPKPATCSSQGPPPGLGLKVPLAKKNALEENLRRAERGGDLNLGLGPEWEGWTPKEDDK